MALTKNSEKPFMCCTLVSTGVEVSRSLVGWVIQAGTITLLDPSHCLCQVEPPLKAHQTHIFCVRVFCSGDDVYYRGD